MSEIIYRFVKDVDVKEKFDEICKELISEHGLKEIFSLKQIHSDIIFVNESGEGDGIVITKPLTAAMVRTADCFSIVLKDKTAGISGVFHSGWKGTLLGISKKGAKMMKSMGCGSIDAVILPGIEQCCFEIGAELVEDFENSGIVVQIRNGRCFADLKEHIIKGLEQEGVENIKDMSSCTFCTPGYFSHRKNRTEKRHGTFVINLS